MERASPRAPRAVSDWFLTPESLDGRTIGRPATTRSGWTPARKTWYSAGRGGGTQVKGAGNESNSSESVVRGIAWVGLVIGSIAVAGAIAVSSPPGPGEPGRERPRPSDRRSSTAAAGRRQPAGEGPGRPRVGDVPGDECLRRYGARRHVPRGARPAFVRAQSFPRSASPADRCASRGRPR